MAYPKGKHGGMSRPMPKGGSKIGDGYSATSADKSYGSHGANVTTSRLNKGGDTKYKGTRSKTRGKPKSHAY